MVIKEAYESPIILTEAAVFQKLKTKSKSIKKTCKDILDGKIRIRKDDEEKVKEFIDKNKDKIKEVYEAVDKDVDNIHTPKDAVEYLASFGVGMASMAAAILSPTAILLGATLIPVQIILVIIGGLSLIYNTVKFIKDISDDSTMSKASDAMKKIQKQLLTIDISKFNNDRLKKEYNALVDELDIAINNIKRTQQEW